MIDDNSTWTKSANTAQHTGSLRSTGLMVPILIAFGWLSVGLPVQPLEGAAQNADQGRGQKTYALRITTDGITELSLSAEQAKVSEIAAEISKRLGVRVFVAPTLEEERVTVTFDRFTLEPALSALAPRVLIDYEIRQNAQPAAQGVYLLGYADPLPALNTVVRGRSQGMLISGNTEDTEKSAADDPLQIVGDKDRLTIVSKQQPVELVVRAIGEVLGVPAEVKYGADAAEPVDADLRDMRAEDAITWLSPNIRLYVRADVNRSEKALLRIVVVPRTTR